MKIMISQPMKDKSYVQILSERAGIVHAIEKRGDTVLDTIFQRTPPRDCNAALWCLGLSLKAMSTCDAVFFMSGWEKARGCRIEHAAAEAYGLKILTSLEED